MQPQESMKWGKGVAHGYVAESGQQGRLCLPRLLQHKLSQELTGRLDVQACMQWMACESLYFHLVSCLGEMSYVAGCLQSMLRPITPTCFALAVTLHCTTASAGATTGACMPDFLLSHDVHVSHLVFEVWATTYRLASMSIVKKVAAIM